MIGEVCVKPGSGLEPASGFESLTCALRVQEALSLACVHHRRKHGPADAYESLEGSLEAVITKEALGFGTARCFHPARARSEITHAAAGAINGLRAGRFKPLRCPRPVRIDLRVADSIQAARIGEIFPTIARTGETSVAWESEAFLQAIIQGSLILGVFFEEILTRACQNLVPWYRTAFFGPQASR